MSSTMICFDGSPSAHRRSPTARSTVTRLADVAAESITETFGAHVHARTFVPTIEGVLMTGGTPRYLCARRASPGAAGESVFETRPRRAAAEDPCPLPRPAPVTGNRTACGRRALIVVSGRVRLPRVRGRLGHRRATRRARDCASRDRPAPPGACVVVDVHDHAALRAGSSGVGSRSEGVRPFGVVPRCRAGWPRARRVSEPNAFAAQTQRSHASIARPGEARLAGDEA
jgi:hypothetical protein